MGRGDEDQGAVPKIVADLLNVQSCNHSFLLFSDNPMDLARLQFHNPCYGSRVKRVRNTFRTTHPIVRDCMEAQKIGSRQTLGREVWDQRAENARKSLLDGTHRLVGSRQE